MERSFTTSLLTLPLLRFEDVNRLVGQHSTTKESRLSKGYKYNSLCVCLCICTQLKLLAFKTNSLYEFL